MLHNCISKSNLLIRSIFIHTNSKAQQSKSQNKIPYVSRNKKKKKKRKSPNFHAC